MIDGLLPGTGGKAAHLEPVRQDIRFVPSRVEAVPKLSSILNAADFVIDCMGWTCHRLALQEPDYDAELNLKSHLTLLRALGPDSRTRLIYLGSRGQYGRPSCGTITEDCPMEPVDIQGIHKLAAEHYFRHFSMTLDLPAVSLRIPNCMGPNQLIDGQDIGLFGGFIRDLINGRAVTVFGANRRRSVVYVEDVATIVTRLLRSDLRQFQAYNVPGHLLPLSAAVEQLRVLIGSGEVFTAPLPDEIARIDVGDTAVDCTRLERAIGPITLTAEEQMLGSTVEYFKELLS